MKRWLSRLVAGFWSWCERVLNEPDERLDPPHAYAEEGTLASYRYGDRCLKCGQRDDQRRLHNDMPCVRTLTPELA